MWHNAVITKQNKELILSVTSLFKVTASEQHLILTLLKSGIHIQAIFHDLYIAKIVETLKALLQTVTN